MRQSMQHSENYCQHHLQRVVVSRGAAAKRPPRRSRRRVLPLHEKRAVQVSASSASLLITAVLTFISMHLLKVKTITPFVRLVLAASGSIFVFKYVSPLLLQFSPRQLNDSGSFLLASQGRDLAGKGDVGFAD